MVYSTRYMSWNAWINTHIQGYNRMQYYCIQWQYWAFNTHTQHRGASKIMNQERLRFFSRQEPSVSPLPHSLSCAPTGYSWCTQFIIRAEQKSWQVFLSSWLLNPVHLSDYKTLYSDRRICELWSTSGQWVRERILPCLGQRKRNPDLHLKKSLMTSSFQTESTPVQTSATS